MCKTTFAAIVAVRTVFNWLPSKLASARQSYWYSVLHNLRRISFGEDCVAAWHTRALFIGCILWSDKCRADGETREQTLIMQRSVNSHLRDLWGSFHHNYVHHVFSKRDSYWSRRKGLWYRKWKDENFNKGEQAYNCSNTRGIFTRLNVCLNNLQN